MDIVGAPHFVRGAFRLLNTLEGAAQLATLLVACAAVRWIRSYTLQLSVRRASAALTVAFLVLVCYYVTHLEKQGITNRRRFVAYTPREFADHVADDVSNCWPPTWTYQDSANRNWSFVIVRSMTPSAFMLPNCHAYFFDGLFRICENDDTLSFVVAHEMAHCLLEHTLEKESLAYFLDRLNTLVWISSLALIRGNVRATLAPWFVSRALHYAVFLPHSRSMELEADSLALRMMAKACFDYRYCIVYFDNAAMLRKRVMGTKKTRKVFSTHPTRHERVNALYRQMSAALALHKSRSCPPLLPMRKNDEIKFTAFLNETLWRA
ncbi:hypothetical protein MRX96_031229 [Rhipicephalus microplus]